MRESIGSIPILAFVMFFIAAISGYLAFTINYSRAFKVKSKIIDIIESNDNQVESYQGVTVTGTPLDISIRNYIKEVGYGKSDEMVKKYCTATDSTKGFKQFQNQGWCYQIVNVSDDKKITRNYVKILTFVSIDVPVINKILPEIKYFVLQGSTKTIKKIK